MTEFGLHPSARAAAFLFTLVAGTMRAELLPEVQAAMKKGIIAAQQQDYPLALRFFQDARKLAPKAPEVLYNLGLAESKIPGRELRAIAWFGAHLAANPMAANTAAVKKLIEELDVKSQSRTSSLIKLLEDAASRIPKDTEFVPTNRRDRELILLEVSSLWAKIGDHARAKKAAELVIKHDAGWKDQAYRAIADAQIGMGDITGAQKTAGLIQGEIERASMQRALVEAKASAKTPPATSIYSDLDRWLNLLGAGSRTWTVPEFTNLTTEMFLDLTGNLKSLPPPSNIYETFWALQEIASKIVRAQNEIDEMLKWQTTPP